MVRTEGVIKVWAEATKGCFELARFGREEVEVDRGCGYGIVLEDA
jgi:hypothetical protein